jgi:hypothetical protein
MWGIIGDFFTSVFRSKDSARDDYSNDYDYNGYNDYDVNDYSHDVFADRDYERDYNGNYDEDY